MKKSNILFLIVVLLFSNIRCTENEKSLIPDLDTVLIPDTVITPTIIIESIDSLKPQKFIYLTIDDAPINGSEYIDSIISAEKIKTNLFLVGNVINESNRFLRYYNTFKENSYIELYNHSYTHASNRYADFYKNPETVLNDFEKNQTEFNFSHKIIRLPGRNLWQVGDKKKNYKQTGSTSAELLAENGYKIFGWDVEWNYSSKDYSPKQSIDELVQEIEDSYNSQKTFTSNHVVLLMHNQMFGKVNENNNLGDLITKLKENNYTFEYLSTYPESSEN